MKINTEFFRIALVGTPGAGKTSVLRILRESATENGYKVDFIDEAATVIMHDTAVRELRRTDSVAFQEKVSLTQLFMEDGAFMNAMAEGAKKYLQITDRALPDTYVYLNGEQRKELRFPLPTVEELNARYDAVICFEIFHHRSSLKAGNALRAEKDISTVEKVYERSLRVYSEHKKFYLVSPYDDIRDKAKRVAEIINELIGETVLLVK